MKIQDNNKNNNKNEKEKDNEKNFDKNDKNEKQNDKKDKNTVNDEYFLEHCGVIPALQYCLEDILQKCASPNALQKKETNAKNVQTTIHQWATEALAKYYMDWQDKEQKENRQRQIPIILLGTIPSTTAATKSIKHLRSSDPKKYFLAEMKVDNHHRLNKSSKIDPSNADDQKLFQRVRRVASKIKPQQTIVKTVVQPSNSVPDITIPSSTSITIESDANSKVESKIEHVIHVNASHKVPRKRDNKTCTAFPRPPTQTPHKLEGLKKVKTYQSEEKIIDNKVSLQSSMIEGEIASSRMFSEPDLIASDLQLVSTSFALIAPCPPKGRPPVHKTTLRRNLSFPETDSTDKPIAPIMQSSLPPIMNTSRPNTAIRSEALNTLHSTPLSLGCRIDEISGIGVKIIEVSNKSPASIAGLQIGDILLSLQDRKIVDRASFEAILFSFLPGQPVKASVTRQDKEMDIVVTLGGRGIKSSEIQQLYQLAVAQSLPIKSVNILEINRENKRNIDMKNSMRLSPLSTVEDDNLLNLSASFEEEGAKTNRSIVEEIVHEE